jgi:hypothetical protein
MSYDAYDDDDQQQSGGALRAQLEKALKDLKAVQEENAKLSANVKTATLENLLRDKQVPPNIQRWMKRDGVEPTAEAVDKWIAENGEDFGYKPGVQTGNVTDSAEKPEGQQSPAEEAPAASAVASVLTPEDVATLQRLQGLLTQGTGQTILSDQVTTAVNTVESQLGPNASFEEAVAALQSQGIDLQNSRG